MDLDTTLESLVANPALAVDLAEVAFQLAADEYPDLDIAAYLDKIETLADWLRPKLTGEAWNDVVELSRLLFQDEGFAANARKYYDPRNSYLNDVMDRKLGIPITLSVIAIAVGSTAGLRVEGVALPGHFIAKLIGRNGEEFLFDPYNGGRVLQPSECEKLVFEATGTRVEADGEMLQGCTSSALITRILNNLKATYLKDGDFLRAARVMGRLLQLNPDDPIQSRDLGVSLLHADQPGSAIAHLKLYLQRVPESEDAQTVRNYLKQARAEIARWN